MKFTYIMGTFFTKFKLLFHQVSFIINTLFPPLHQMLYASHIKIFADTSELFIHTVFQLIRCVQNSILGMNLLEGQKDGSYRVLNWDCR
jgi:hypothetical protein